MRGSSETTAPPMLSIRKEPHLWVRLFCCFWGSMYDSQGFALPMRMI